MVDTVAGGGAGWPHDGFDIKQFCSVSSESHTSVLCTLICLSAQVEKYVKINCTVFLRSSSH